MFDLSDKRLQKQTIFVGDSPNDASMFYCFENPIGVTNIQEFSVPSSAEPAYITNGFAGEGFVEVANCLLNTNGKNTEIHFQFESPVGGG